MSCRGASGSGSRARTVKLLSALTAADASEPGEVGTTGAVPPGSVCGWARVVDPFNVTDRIVIEGIRPSTPGGYPAKAVVGRPVRITGDVFRDGHDILAARVRWRRRNGAKGKWSAAPMHPQGNDRFEAVIEPTELGAHEFVVDGWTDRLATWRHEVSVKLAAGQAVELELEEG